MPDSDMPVFSFNNSKYTDKIMTESFNISGNKFSAFYDADHKLIFVLDETRTENTPNILLIIADREGRKWDDILSNDYKMDLEDVRPKKNNKYQKLDINYTGLPVYGQLIADYKTGGTIDNALDNLNKFRITVGQELAQARLNAAMREIEISTETIKKTEESLIKLHSNIKSLKTKLNKIRSEVGKKPTKESAAKILKVQSQMDKVNEKEKRAKARLRRAKKRLEDARNDSTAARNVLKATNNVKDLINIEKSQEPRMADEPKPLFNKDPEIIDDKIAFQPIGFETPSFNPTEFNIKQTNSEDNTTTPDSITFTAPQPIEPTVVEPVINTTEPTTIPVNMPQQTIAVPQQQPIAKLSEPTVPPVVPPVEMERPASPITNPDVTVLHPPVGAKKPSFVYYIMLVILIGLCILTLSIYQSRMDKSGTPNLAQPSVVSENVPTETAPAPQTNESAFIMPQPEPVAEPAPQPMPQPAPIVKPQPQPVPVITEPEPQPAPVIEPEPMPAPVAMPEPVAEPEPMPAPIAEPEPVQEPEPEVISVPDEKSTITLPLKPEYPVHGPSNYNEEHNTVSSQLCTSGDAPDENGCCSGESFRWVESMNGYACCAIADGECYPPLK